jgi:phosphoglycolate phosphatase
MTTAYSLLDSFELFIFDLDGTLINSHGQIESAMDEARIALGYLKSPTGQIFQNLGLPVENLFYDLNLSSDKAEHLILEFRKNLNRMIKQGNECFPGVISVLTQIQLLGKKVSVATGKSTSMATHVIENSPLSGLVDFIQGTDDFPPKPDPEVIIRCLQKFPNLKAVMIGDREEDVLAAKSAGVASIGIAQSAHSVETLLAAGATSAYKSFDSILKDIFSP